METRMQSHVSYRLMYHVVWIPKRRWKVLKQGVSDYCTKVIKSVTTDMYPDVVIEEINTQIDHVHVVIVIPPKYSISKVIGDIKRTSSRKLRKEFEYLRVGRDALWSIGYFISSVGLDEGRIRNYVNHQEKEEAGQLQAVWDKGATGRA